MNDISFIQYATSMLAYFAVLILVVEIMRRNVKFSHVFWIASLLTFPLWLMGGVEGWFRWAKIFSVILPTIIVGFCRMANYGGKSGKVWDLFKKNWIYYFFYGVLFLNIAEATLKDIALGNWFNVIPGIVLCLTIPLPLKFWTIPKKENYGDLITYTTVGWNLLYTTWNACFVYGEGAMFFASSLCILLAAELYPVFKRRPELYLSARIYTLAFHLLVRSIFPKLFPNLMNAEPWFNETALQVWGVVNLVIAIPYFIWYILKMKKGTYCQHLVERYDELGDTPAA